MNKKYFLHCDEIMKQLKKGAFLNVSDGENSNTMTIGWALIGIMWSKAVMMVAVRPTRYTFDLIEKAEDFSVSIPIDVDLDKELAYCGTHSGRDEDKLEACGLKFAAGKEIKSPHIAECDLHYECKIVYKQAMDAEFLSNDIDKNQYSKNDYHTLYFGEIVGCYKD